MPYIILAILVIAIVVVAVRQQKFNHQNAQNNKASREDAIRNKEKESSIEVNDYVEVNENDNN